MTTSSFSPLTTAETIFKEVVWDPLLKVGEAALFAEVPILDAPVLGTIDDIVIQAVGDLVFDKIRLLVDIAAIQLLNPIRQQAYANASLELKVIAEEKGADSDEFKQALAKAAAAQSAFTGIDAA